MHLAASARCMVLYSAKEVHVSWCHPGQIDIRAIPLPPGPVPPPRQPTPPLEPQPQPKPPMPPGRATLLPTPGRRTPPDPSPQREPEDPGHSLPGRQGGRNGDDSPSSSGDGGNNGDGENSGDRGNSGDGNSSEGNGSGSDSQNGDGDDDDGDKESQHSGLGPCSTPSSQKGDASMEDQTSQAEEILAKKTGKTGLQSPSHLAKVQARGKEGSLATSFRDSSRPGHNIPALA